MSVILWIAASVAAAILVVALILLVIAAFGAGIGLFFGALLWAIEWCVGPLAVESGAPAALPWWGWLVLGLVLGGGLFTVKVTRKGGA